jgi:glycosyltransferase involved in cell wall biosynthesis
VLFRSNDRYSHTGGIMALMRPLFSIIIPTLNEEKYLPKLLQCLTQQKTKNFEVIIVDANSKDRTKAIVSSFKKDLSIRMKMVKKGNLSLQKNIGAQEAKGKYLIFFDADMLIGPNFTTIAQREIKRRKGFVFIPYVYPIEKKEYPEVYAAISFINQLVGLSHVSNKPFSAGPPQIWEQQVFLHIGGFDQIFGEDHQIVRKAYKWGLRVQQIPNLKVKFSLRRMKQQGRIRLFVHFLRAHVYLLFNDTLGKPFEYEMGGQLYWQKKGEIKKKFRMLSIEKIAKDAKKFLRERL